MKTSKISMTILLVSILTIVLLSACKHDEPPEPSGDGFVSGTVIDAVSRAPLADVSIIISDENGSQVATSITDSAGRFYVTLNADRVYDFNFTRSGHYTSNYSGVAVLSDEEKVLEAVLQIDNSISGVGSISGQIRDAVDGSPVSSALLRFRSGINVSNGPIIFETSTDVAGNYTVTGALQTGHYTCEISLQGYVTNYFTVLVLGGQLLANHNATISPAVPTGETRIVLSWGALPRDLDSHLTGPLGDNAGQRFHIYFVNRGSATSQPFTLLDVDDVASFGPETITIKQQYQGLYRYSVHDFTNRSSTISTALANSDAKVTVYQAGKNPRVFNVPSGSGSVWTVFELTGDAISPINTMSSQSISSFSQSIIVDNDAAIISSVPYK